MSTFPGLLREIPNVSIDRFDGRNLRSTVFFLSHCHADHMVGLKSQDFHSYLRKQENIFMYCSEVSALFLSYNHLCGLDEKVRTLPIGKPFSVNVPGNQQHITVTALPAGHCPGSVMFLFEYDSKYILYTGDCRMVRKDIEAMKGLKDSEGVFLPLETLYLDTTFFHPVYSYLPSRDESMMELVQFCRSWLRKNENNFVDLRTPATYGVEYVLITLFKEFGEAVHVPEVPYKKYCRIPELAPTITRNPNSRLHACVAGHLLHGHKLFLKAHPEKKDCGIRSVKLCALHARNLEEGQSIVSYNEEQKLYRIVYSSHSSHTELRQMVETLRPKYIVPCVMPENLLPEEVVAYLQPTTDHNVEESDSGDLSPLRFSSYETEPETEPERNCSEENETTVSSTVTHESSKHLRLLTRESSEEEFQERQVSAETDSQEFRWDCKYDPKVDLAVFKNNRLSTQPRKVRKIE